jgi:hypothetical protein
MTLSRMTISRMDHNMVQDYSSQLSEPLSWEPLGSSAIAATRRRGYLPPSRLLQLLAATRLAVAATTATRGMPAPEALRVCTQGPMEIEIGFYEATFSRPCGYAHKGPAPRRGREPVEGLGRRWRPVEGLGCSGTLRALATRQAHQRHQPGT